MSTIELYADRLVASILNNYAGLFYVAGTDELRERIKAEAKKAVLRTLGEFLAQLHTE